MLVLNWKRTVLLSCIILLFFIEVAYPTKQVVIEFLYWDPSTWCPDCFQEIYQAFLSRNETMNKIQNEYGNKVLVKWIEFHSDEGRKKREQYNISDSNFNSIVINYTVVYQPKPAESFNETYIREVIDAFLGKTAPPLPPPSSPLPLLAAFTFGFFETFSPCLIALLSFILSYTLGKATAFKEGMLRVMTFGIGFVSAAVILGATVALTLISMPNIQNTIMWIVCILVIIFGLNLLGLFNLPVETKPMVKKLARRYALTYAGLFLLGFTFYFLDPCIAPFCFTMLVMFQSSEFIILLLLFCLGAIIPFISIGFIAGFVSKLARSTYKHRSKIRAISGLILITYSIYLIVFYLL